VDFKLIWFDSLGAKSSCTLVTTPDVKVLIDPGVAVMHPTFPAPDSAKLGWLQEGRLAVKKAAFEADIIVISHYHYDHFTDFDKEIYEGKIVLAKNPNEYINDSQRKRALRFYEHLYEAFGENLKKVLLEPKPGEWNDPFYELRIAQARDFGDYSERREILLEKGRSWFLKRREKWKKYKLIPELELEKVKVKFADGKTFKFGDTLVRFTRPLFHGIEYSRVGWVLATVIEYGGWKFLHSSDVNGPIIEDYAELIIREDPDVLILDGPMTYMLGYTLNLINFRRALENVLRIVEETSTKIIVYDHHLPREPKFKERTSEVWNLGKKLGKKIVTAAEFMGLKPVILSI